MRIPVDKTSFTSLRSSSPKNSKPGMVGYDYGCNLNMRTKLKSFILTVLLFALIPGVSAQMQPDSTTVHRKITGINALKGKWYLQPVLDSDTSTGRIPEIQFDIKQA